MKAIILAAGEGTRLRPFTLETPKPLLKIGDKTIIERIFEALPDEIDEVIVVVKHLEEKIRNYLGSNFLGKKIIYAKQGSKKGTFGALKSAGGSLKKEERFLTINGDDLHDKGELTEFLKHRRAMGIQKAIMPNYYQVITQEGLIKGFRAQTEEEKISGAMIATGAYVLDASIFSEEGVLVSGGEYGLPQTILAQKDHHPITAVVTTNWRPINTPADLYFSDYVS